MRARVFKLLRPLALGIALMPGVAFADAAWEVDTLIPELISIRVPSTTIAFELDAATYPPEAFPARYPATVPEGGVLQVEVFSNVEGAWSLVLELPDLVDEGGERVLPAEQVLVRVDEGIWLRAGASPQIVFTSSGPTDGWLPLRVELALELGGTERAGAYRVDAIVSAIREPGF